MLIRIFSLNKVFRRGEKFAKNDEGAVTVDWIVLTAAIVGVAAAATTAVTDSVVALGGKIENDVANSKIGPQ